LRAERIRLTEPRDGAVLGGGSLVTISWTADALPRGVEEWEAFLSVDGGRYFATRITPHLDAHILTATFEVPNLTADDARILLRFGDEQREREVEVPARFSIRFDPAAPRTQLLTARGEGEPARPGAPGVAVWVAGARNGTGSRTFSHRSTSLRGNDAVLTAEAASTLEAESESSESTLAHQVELRTPRSQTQTLFRRALPSPRAIDLLLATRRLNV
jgi:hypothetical protein